MQICKKCGREIKYIATGLGVSTACEAEKQDFITENGFKKSGYLIHICKIAEAENAENENTKTN